MKPGKPKPPKPPPRSWLWVVEDRPEGRIIPHEVTLGIEIDPTQGATLDLYVERGGKQFLGLAVQSLRVPGLRDLKALSGAEVIDPPPSFVGIGSLGSLTSPKVGCASSGGLPAAPSELRRLQLLPDRAAAAEPAGPQPGAELNGPMIDMDAEEAAPDDDPSLGDIDSYRRRRAEEGKLEPHEPEPELDPDALAEADMKAAAERVLVAPDQAYEVESIRLRFGPLRGPEVDIDVTGLCGEVDEHGDVGRSGIPFGGKLVARVESA